MAAITPPLAVPSSLVRIQAGQSQRIIECLDLCQCVLPGVGIQHQQDFVRGLRQHALLMTRLTLRISSIRCSWVGSRPAVSASTMSILRACAAWTASKHTAAASPPCWLMTVTWLRAPHSASCSRAAAQCRRLPTARCGVPGNTWPVCRWRWFAGSVDARHHDDQRAATIQVQRLSKG